jgi:aminoglycoside phosphotransferase (APT) family kinase protein
MESQVFALDETHILKIYHRAPPLSHLQTLQHFYEHLDTHSLPYALPQIKEIGTENGQFYVIEKRLEGRNLEQVTQEGDATALDQILGRYLQALHAFSRVTYTAPVTQYKLFDETSLSHVTRGDWHAFLKRYLEQRLAETPCLQKDVANLDEKLARLFRILSQPYPGKLSVIHGDFFPGNLLVDESGSVTSLLDFGLFTMFGDHLFDVATGCVFFDMYDQLGQNIRQRLLTLAAEIYGTPATGVLYRYILIFSLIAANIYAPDCSDGHYQWCVANLNTPEYWDNLQ